MAPDLSPKRLQLLKEAFPQIARVAVLWNAANPTKILDWREVQAVAPTMGVTVLSHEVRRPEDFTNAFIAMTTERPDALMTLSDPLTLNSRTSIVSFAASARLPAIYGVREFAEAGGLMVYGPNLADMYRRGAAYVHKILNGTKPADLPIEQSTRFELVINLRAAKALGLEIPPTLLARADEVIE